MGCLVKPVETQLVLLWLRDYAESCMYLKLLLLDQRPEVCMIHWDQPQVFDRRMTDWRNFCFIRSGCEISTPPPQALQALLADDEPTDFEVVRDSGIVLEALACKDGRMPRHMQQCRQSHSIPCRQDIRRTSFMNA